MSKKKCNANPFHDACAMQKEVTVMNTREYLAENNTKPRGSICKTIASLWKVLWWRFLFCQRTDSKNKQKHS